MGVLKEPQYKRLLSAPDETIPVILVFGRDTGLVSERFSELFARAWELEFTEGDYTGAFRAYEEKQESYITYVRLSAVIGQARSLAKLGKIAEAISA